MCFRSSGLQTIVGNVARPATEETQVVVHAMLSLFLSEPTIFPELRRKGRGWLWAGQSSRGGSIPGGTGVWRTFVTRVLVGHSRSLALVIELILSFVHLSHK